MEAIAVVLLVVKEPLELTAPSVQRTRDYHLGEITHLIKHLSGHSTARIVHDCVLQLAENERLPVLQQTTTNKRAFEDNSNDNK